MYLQMIFAAMNCNNKNEKCKKCRYSELLWSVFSSIWTEYGEIGRISPYSIRMRENADQNNFEYEPFLTQCL